MTVVATVAVPASAFPLGSLLESDPEGRLSVDAVVPTADGLVPYLWVRDASDSITDRLEEAPVVAAATVVDEVDETRLVRVTWTDRVNGLLESIRRTDAIVTSAVGTADRWTFRIRFPSYDTLSAFYAACSEQDVDVELLELHEPVTSERNRRYGLTTGQRELVLAAYEAGYFDVPRETTLVELGEELEISDSAVSQRLRRGLAALISSTLVPDGDSESDRDPLSAVGDGVYDYPDGDSPIGGWGGNGDEDEDEDEA